MSAYAISDIHGNYEIWQKIKDKIKSEDTLYILGDCADRGSNGYKIIKEALAMPNVNYIKGNHEDMLAGAIQEIERHRHPDDYYFCLMSNGGRATFNDWVKDGEDYSLGHMLDKLPEHLSYVNQKGQIFELTHAGYTPPMGNWKDLIWSREHFTEAWPDGFEDTYIIHGHTPNPYLADDLGLEGVECIDQPLVYADGHKICIDNLTIRTKSAILYNLDDMSFELIK